MKLINIGFGNMVSAAKLVAIVSPESAPVKRIVQEAKEKGTVIDATQGRRTRAVIIMDSDHVVLSALLPETIANRLTYKDEDDKRLLNNLNIFKNIPDFPGGPVVKSPSANARVQSIEPGFDPWSGKTQHAMGQLSPGASMTDGEDCNY